MSRRGKNKSPPYRRQKYLCSAGELRFYKKLVDAVGDEFDAHMQVSVAAVLRVPAEEWKRWGELVAPLRFDFVLVKRGTSFAAAAVELDDKTHLLPERRKRDKFLNEACRLAEFPLVRVKAAQRYDVDALRETVKAALPKGATQSRPGDKPAKGKDGTPLGWTWKRIK